MILKAYNVHAFPLGFKITDTNGLNLEWSLKFYLLQSLEGQHHYQLRSYYTL